MVNTTHGHQRKFGSGSAPEVLRQNKQQERAVLIDLGDCNIQFSFESTHRYALEHITYLFRSCVPWQAVKSQ